MKLNRTQKMYAGVLGASLLALAADQIISAPSGADAAPATESIAIIAPPAGGDEPPVQRGDATSAARASLAEGFRAAAAVPKGEDVIDAFRPPAAWLGLPEVQVRPEDETPGERFLREHRLTAVIGDTSTGVARVSGHAVRVGQQLDGFRLVSIGSRTATFESDTERVALTIVESAAGRQR